MRVRVIKAREHGSERKVHFASSSRSQVQHVRIRSNSPKTAATDCYRLSLRLSFISREDVSGVQKLFRFFAAEKRQNQQATHALDETASRKCSHVTLRNAQFSRRFLPAAGR